MTILTVPTLTESQQALIDARLDTIDRMLLGRVPRADRVAIVREAESQIQELLAEREGGERSREDVIDVLRRLDPPEAYMPEESDAGGFARSPRFAPPTGAGSVKPAAGRFGRLGGILGLCSLGMVLLIPVVYLLSAVLESEFFFVLGFGGLGVLGLAESVAGLTLSIGGRRAGVLPVLGIISSAIAMPIFVLELLFTMYIILNM